jgi:hypothetical protein
VRRQRVAERLLFPAQERLAKGMGAGVRSVVRYIQELEKEHFVAIKKRGNASPGFLFAYLLHTSAPTR